MSRIIVVGAGLAGLVAARRLMAEGADVTVLEAGDTAGGHARTITHHGFRLEVGPNTLTGKANTLIGEAESVGVEAHGTEGPGSRFIYRRGKMHSVPPSPMSLITGGAMSRRGWLRLFAEPLMRGRPAEGETVNEFFTRRIGAEAARVLVGSFVSGIHAGDPDALAIAEAFPTLAAWEREKGSLIRGAFSAPRKKGARKGLVVMRGGMGSLTGAMAASLGDRLKLGTPVTALRRQAGWVVDTAKGTLTADTLVLAVPPPAAARLLTPLAPEVGESLAEIPMARLAVVHFGGKDPRGEAPRGFGALIPRGEGIRTLGVLFIGSQVPDRMPGPGHWLHTAFIGGATDPTLLEESDEAIAATVVADSARLTGFDARPTFTKVIRHPAAIPQMIAGHRAKVAAAAERFDDLVLAGNWVRGVSAEDAALSGLLAAEQVLARALDERSACA